MNDLLAVYYQIKKEKLDMNDLKFLNDNKISLKDKVKKMLKICESDDNKLDIISVLLESWLVKYKFKINNYLDIGCFDGQNTKLCKLFFSPNEVHGIDLENFLIKENEKILFKIWDGKKIPHKDDYFDMITVFNSFHHITEDAIQIILKEINRVLKVGGYLLIFDFDVMNDAQKDYLDLIHTYENSMWNFSNYLSFDKLVGDCKKNGINFVDVKYFGSVNIKNMLVLLQK